MFHDFKFDLDNRFAYIILISLLAFYLAINITNFQYPIIFYDHSRVIIPFLKNCDIHTIPSMRDPLRYYAICFSDRVFTNSLVLPSIASLTLIAISFFYIRQLTGKNHISLIGAFLFGGTHTMFLYGFTSTYPQFWVTFLLVSIYFINTKRWFLSPIIYGIGLMFHGITLLNLPLDILYITISSRKPLEKNILYSAFTLIAIVSVIYTLNGGYYITNGEQVTLMKITISSITDPFRSEILLFCTIPIVIPLLLMIKDKISKYISISIILLVVQTIMLDTVTNLGQEPYRMTPLVILIVCSYCYIFTKKDKIPVLSKCIVTIKNKKL